MCMAGGSRRKRGSQKKNQRASRQPAKDHSHPQNDSPLAEELTALSSIFQEDFTLISEDACTEFSITLYPHADGGRSNVSAELHVRCLPGYPYKPPKLQVKCLEGLSHEELLSLHSLLIDQASAISREGRVMVYNLVEAAQEFLSEHIGSGHLQEFENDSEADSGVDKSQAVTLNNTACTLQDITGPPVYGFVDLFNELGDEILWTGEVHQLNHNGLEKHVGNATMRNILPAENLNSRALKNAPQNLLPDDKESSIAEPELFKLVSDKLPVSDDQEDGVGSGKANQFFSVSELLEKVYNGLYFANHKNPISGEQSSASSASSNSNLLPEQMCCSLQDRSEHSVRKDFLLAHLLRLVCCPRGPLPNAWPALALQIQKFHVIPQGVMDLLITQPRHFQLAFQGIFAEAIKDATDGLIFTKSFWNASKELLCGEDNTKSTSRYSSDFEELSMLGKGGFGSVALCKNNLDGRRYAVKKIMLADKSQSLNKKILREVTTLSRLQHHHIVRYYQAWFETVAGITHVASEAETSGEWEKTGSYFMPLAVKGPGFDYTEDNVVERTYLYIQMEYCPRTLREILDFSAEALDEVTAWRYFRQIVEGLAYIHGQGIIHRDLTPNNIFFDVFDDIKIGDFGLAKFTSLEQPDREAFLSSDLHGSSLDGTGQVGTYLYTAPEVGQGWPLIDEKADMYSLGVILLELWHPFSTAMERITVLNELKNKGVPSSWALKYPQQAALVQDLMSANPADRPSAMHVLKNHLPPRMEDEALDDVLRTIQKAENSYVLDQIVSALFDEERISLIAQKIERDQLSYSCIEKTFFQDQILKIAKDIFTSHGAKGFNTSRLSLIDRQRRGQIVTMIDSAGRMLELRSEMRKRFVCWVAANQVTSIKHFEISQVYRKAAGPNAPDEYYQGDFDIIGDSFGLAEAEVIKVVVDILSKCALNESYEIHINHSNILEAIWSWSGVKKHERRDVAKLLSLAGCAPPQSSDRKSRWVHIRQQLVQGLKLQEFVVDRLQTVERRWNGYPDVALSRLRGGLADSSQISTAIDELAALQSYLRVWSIGKHVHIDALMIPVEEYHRGVFFQVYLRKEGNLATSSAGMLLAVGGRYDQLVQEHWTNAVGLSAPGAVGVSIALEKLILEAMSECEQDSSGVEVLVCSKGGGGLLRERMEIVSELWDGSIKAEFVHSPSPSLTEQYDYANEHGIKWLVMITEADLAHGNNVKVRNMETRKVEDVPREDLVKFFTELIATMTNKKNRLISLAK